MSRIVLLAFLLLIFAPTLSQAQSDSLIVPGQRIGPYTLALSVNDLQFTLGRMTTTSATDPADHLSVLSIFCWDDIHAAFHDRTRVEYLFHSGTRFVTEKGIGISSSRSAVEAAYGAPTAVAGSWLIYDQIGLAVRTTGWVAVFRPGTARSIWKY